MKRIVAILVLISSTVIMSAQMMVSPYIPEDMEGVTSNNVKTLENRLATIISQNGMISAAGSRFILTMNWTVLDKEVIASGPTVIMYKLDVTFALGDGMTGTKYSSATIPLKGAGNNEAKAILSALKGISVHNAEIGNLVKQGTKRIIEYYENNHNQIMTSVKSMISQKNYEEALWTLAQIPQEVSYYSEAQGIMTQAYKAQVNTNAAQQLQRARALWAASPSRENADAVMALIEDIDTSSGSYSGAKALMNEVKSRVKSLDDSDRAEEIRRNNHERNMEQARINAVKDIAIAYANSRPKVVYNTKIIHRW